jgi:hypothetical protein
MDHLGHGVDVAGADHDADSFRTGRGLLGSRTVLTTGCEALCADTKSLPSGERFDLFTRSRSAMKLESLT